MTQESIFAILQEKDVQEQWLNICRLHRITKEYLLVAEEVCEAYIRQKRILLGN